MAEPWKKYQQPGNPYVVSGGPRLPTPRYEDEADRNRSEANLARGRVEMLPFEQAKSQADATLAQAQVDALGRTEDAVKYRQKVANLNGLVEQINRVEHLYRQTIEPTSGLGGFFDFLPTNANKQFNTAGSGLADQGLAAFRTPGQGSQSNLEAEQFWEANRPSASNFDSAIEEKLRQMRLRVDVTRQELGLPAADWGVGQQEGGAAPPSVGGIDRPPPPIIPDASSGNNKTFAQGGYRTEDDPTLAGVNAQVNAMLKKGEPIGRIAKHLEGLGVPPREVLPSLQRAAKFRRENPGYKGDWNVNIDDRLVPMSGVRQFMNNAAQTPGGAYAVNAADALTLGTLDNMTGDPALARAGMAGLEQQNPYASLTGKVTGGALAAGGSELAAARMGLQGVRAAMAGDALFGAGYGAGSADDGNRAMGAFTGTLAGVGGGAAGRKLTSGAGRAFTGARDEGVRMLADRGVPLTVGQIAGRGGVAGKGVKKLEDALESVPILGSAIRARREQGVSAFNRAAFKEALEPIGANASQEIGEQGVESARDAVSGAYDNALSGVRLKADQVFVRDMKRAMAAGSRLHTEVAEDFAKIIQDQLAPELANGTLTGEGYQALRQVLRQERAAWKGKPRGHQYGQALRQVEGALEALVRRRAPGVVDSLNRADQAYGRTKVLQDSVSRAKNGDQGGIFTPAQLGISATQSARKFGSTQGTTQQPFFDLQRAGQQILPSHLPNSGTMDRAWASAILPATLGGGGAALGLPPEQIAIMASLGLPFTKAGQATLQRLLVQRPELVRSIGQQIMARGRTGGLFGVGVGTSLSAE